jgi:hypothetical protein
MASISVSLDIQKMFGPNFNFQDSPRLERLITELKTIVSDLFTSNKDMTTDGVTNPAPSSKQDRQHVRKHAILLFNLCSSQPLITNHHKADLLWITTQFLLFSSSLSAPGLSTPSVMKLSQQHAALLLQSYIRTISALLSLPNNNAKLNTYGLSATGLSVDHGEKINKKNKHNNAITINQNPSTLSPFLLFTQELLPIMIHQCDIAQLLTQHPDIIFHSFLTGFKSALLEDNILQAYDCLESAAFIIHLLTPRVHSRGLLSNAIHTYEILDQNTANVGKDSKERGLVRENVDEPINGSELTSPDTLTNQLNTLREIFSKRKNVPNHHQQSQLLKTANSFIIPGESTMLISVLYQVIIILMKKQSFRQCIDWILLAISLIPFCEGDHNGNKFPTLKQSPKTTPTNNDSDGDMKDGNEENDQSTEDSQKVAIPISRQAKLYFLLSICYLETNLHSYALSSINCAISLVPSDENIFLQCKTLLTLLSHPNILVEHDNTLQLTHNDNILAFERITTLSNVLFPKAISSNCIEPEGLFQTIFSSLSRIQSKSTNSVEICCSILASIPPLLSDPRTMQSSINFATRLHALFVHRFSSSFEDNDSPKMDIIDQKNNTRPAAPSILLINHCYLSWLLEHNHISTALSFIKSTTSSLSLSEQSLELIASITIGLFNQQHHQDAINWSESLLDLIQINDLHNIIIINLVLAQSLYRISSFTKSVQISLKIIQYISHARNEGYVPPPVGLNPKNGMDDLEIRVLVIIIKNYLAMRNFETNIQDIQRYLARLLELSPPIDSLCLLVGEIQSLLTSMPTSVQGSAQDISNSNDRNQCLGKLEQLQMELLEYVILEIPDQPNQPPNKQSPHHNIKTALLFALVKLQTRSLITQYSLLSRNEGGFGGEFMENSMDIDQDDTQHDISPKNHNTLENIANHVFAIIRSLKSILSYNQSHLPQISPLIQEIIPILVPDDIIDIIDITNNESQTDEKLPIMSKMSVSLKTASVEDLVTLSQCVWNTITISLQYQFGYYCNQLLLFYMIIITITQEKLLLYQSLSSDRADDVHPVGFPNELHGNSNLDQNNTEFGQTGSFITINDSKLHMLLESTVFRSPAELVASCLQSLLLMVNSLEVCYITRNNHNNDADIHSQENSSTRVNSSQKNDQIVYNDSHNNPITLIHHYYDKNHAIETSIDVLSAFQILYTSYMRLNPNQVPNNGRNKDPRSKSNGSEFSELYFLFVTIKLRCFLYSPDSHHGYFFPPKPDQLSRSRQLSSASDWNKNDNTNTNTNDIAANSNLDNQNQNINPALESYDIYKNNILSLLPQNLSIECYDCLLSESLQAKKYDISAILIQDRLENTVINTTEIDFCQVIVLYTQLVLIYQHISNSTISPMKHYSFGNGIGSPYQDPILTAVNDLISKTFQYFGLVEKSFPQNDHQNSTPEQLQYLNKYIRPIVNLTESHSICKIVFNHSVGLYYQGNLSQNNSNCLKIFQSVVELRRILLLKPFSLLYSIDKCTNNAFEVGDLSIDPKIDGNDIENDNNNEFVAPPLHSPPHKLQPSSKFASQSTFIFANQSFDLVDFDTHMTDSVQRAIESLKM